MGTQKRLTHKGSTPRLNLEPFKQFLLTEKVTLSYTFYRKCAVPLSHTSIYSIKTASPLQFGLFKIF